MISFSSPTLHLPVNSILDDDDESSFSVFVGAMRLCIIMVEDFLVSVTSQKLLTSFNPLKGRDVNWLHLAIQV